MDFQVLAPLAFILSIPVFVVLALMIDALNRIDFKFAWKKFVFIWFIAYVAAFSIMPFVVPPEFLTFGSYEISVVLVLMFAFAVYLAIFNYTRK